MKKTIIVRKKDKKITAVCDGNIKTDNDFLEKHEVDLSVEDLNDLINDSIYRFYVNGKIVKILPESVEKEENNKKIKKEIVEKLKDENITAKELSKNVLRLIDIL